MLMLRNLYNYDVEANFNVNLPGILVKMQTLSVVRVAAQWQSVLLTCSWVMMAC